jgi:hypothetical protein
MNISRACRLSTLVFLLTVIGTVDLQAQSSEPKGSDQFTVKISELSSKGKTVSISGGRTLTVTKVDCSDSGLPVVYIAFSVGAPRGESATLELKVTALNEGKVDERVMLKGSQLTVASKATKVSEMCGSGLSQMLLLNEAGATPFYDELIIQL